MINRNSDQIITPSCGWLWKGPCFWAAHADISIEWANTRIFSSQKMQKMFGEPDLLQLNHLESIPRRYPNGRTLMPRYGKLFMFNPPGPARFDVDTWQYGHDVIEQISLPQGMYSDVCWFLKQAGWYQYIGGERDHWIASITFVDFTILLRSSQTRLVCW